MFNARHRSKAVWSSFALAASVMGVAVTAAQSPQVPPAQSTNGGGPAAAKPTTTLPADYVIGPNDLLSVVFWREPEMSGQVRVRPDGRISVPLLNDVPAVGLTPDELRRQLEQAAKKYIADPNATVVVVEINSRSVYVVGQVTTPGVYPLNTPMNVLQAIAAAGGLLEFADGEHIVIERNEPGGKARLRFNYSDVIKGKKAEQNVTLKPGDTVIVP
jgi:polysaccharide biosynthesis/export protein